MKFPARPTVRPSELFGRLQIWLADDKRHRVTHHTQGPGGYTAWRFTERWDAISETYIGGWNPISHHRTKKAAMRACVASSRKKVT